jgi:hypothetical protein
MSFNIWIQYGDGQPVKVAFGGGDVDDLVEAIEKKLSNKLGNVDADEIVLRKHGEGEDLERDLQVDATFANTAKTPLQVIRGK